MMQGRSTGLTFHPGRQNTLTFNITGRYYLRDIELLDKDGSPYQPTDTHMEEGSLELGQEETRSGIGSE